MEVILKFVVEILADGLCSCCGLRASHPSPATLNKASILSPKFRTTYFALFERPRRRQCRLSRRAHMRSRSTTPFRDFAPTAGCDESEQALHGLFTSIQSSSIPLESTAYTACFAAAYKSHRHQPSPLRNPISIPRVSAYVLPAIYAGDKELINRYQHTRLTSHASQTDAGASSEHRISQVRTDTTGSSTISNAETRSCSDNMSVSKSSDDG